MRKLVSKIYRFLVMQTLVLLVGCVSVSAEPNKSKVMKVYELGGGWYSSADVVTGRNLFTRYRVDSIARLCYMLDINSDHNGIGVSTTEVDCKNLARRTEWKSIITWLEY